MGGEGEGRESGEGEGCGTQVAHGETVIWGNDERGRSKKVIADWGESDQGGLEGKI